MQSLTFNGTDIEGSVLLSCADTFALGLVLASDMLDKKLLSSAKTVFNKSARRPGAALNCQSKTNQKAQRPQRFLTSENI